MRILVLADIHANLCAFQAVLTDARKYKPQAAIFLGDLIDYGMRPNEVITQMEDMPLPILCALRGNHEQALLSCDRSRFSSERGAVMSQYTQAHLTQKSCDYLKTLNADGYAEMDMDGIHMLLVHGSMGDPYWGTIRPGDMEDIYKPYDMVLSAHSHRPHCFATYFPDPESPYRGEKKTVFVNPGAVGQPRNHNPKAQYAIIDVPSGEVILAGAVYSIREEQSLYPPDLPAFYKDRLVNGV